MPAHRSARLTIALVAVALILGVGVATFFLGRKTPGPGTGDSGYVELDLSTVRGSDAPLEEVLFLPWGDGPADASRKGDPFRRSTIEVVFSSEGMVFVVDHPEGVYGARVRWFSPEGQLVGTRLAPPGSTFFSPQSGGYNYVVAKSGGRSETAVVVTLADSRETTYTIPLQLNSGGLAWSGDTLYAQIAPSEVDFEAETIRMSFALVPVAVGGVQVDDAAADAKVLDVWGFGLDGQAYTSTTNVEGLDLISSPITVVIGSGEKSVRVPQRYRLLGVTADSQICLANMAPLLVPTERIRQAAAAWNSSHDPFNEVLTITIDGTITSSIALPYSSVLARYDDSVPMSVCRDGLYSLRADEKGVSVVVHRIQ